MPLTAPPGPARDLAAAPESEPLADAIVDELNRRQVTAHDDRDDGEVALDALANPARRADLADWLIRQRIVTDPLAINGLAS